LKRRTKYALQVFCQRYVETICKHWLGIVLGIEGIEIVFYTNHQQQNQGSQKKCLKL